MPMCIGSFRYTRSGLVSLSEIPIQKTSPFPPSGNEGYNFLERPMIYDFYEFSLSVDALDFLTQIRI